MPAAYSPTFLLQGSFFSAPILAPILQASGIIPCPISPRLQLHYGLIAKIVIRRVELQRMNINRKNSRVSSLEISDEDVRLP